MSDVFNYLWLIPFLPLLAAGVIALLGPELLKEHSHWPCVVAIGLSAFFSFLVLFNVWGTFHEVEPGKGDKVKQVKTHKVYYTWFEAGEPGTQGYVNPAEANRDTERRGAAPTAVLLDPAGTLGHLYGAQATPHMYVIDPQGQLVYMGAIDNVPSIDPSDVARAKNYVAVAIEEVKAGKRVTVPVTKAYGCSVKYASGS